MPRLMQDGHRLNVLSCWLILLLIGLQLLNLVITGDRCYVHWPWLEGQGPRGRNQHALWGSQQKEVRIVRPNHYQDCTVVIFTAFVAADMKLDGNAIVIATNTSLCLHAACHEWRPLRGKWIMESGLLWLRACFRLWVEFKEMARKTHALFQLPWSHRWYICAAVCMLS